MILLNIVFSSVSFGLSAVCGTCLPNGCVVATHSRGDRTESAEGDPHLLWGRGPHLGEAPSGLWEGERASEGLRIYKVSSPVLQPAIALRLILRFPLRYRLPLHIEGCICSTELERIDVINHVSRTAAAGSAIGRARMLALEVVLSSRAAPVAAMASRPRTVRAEGRAMAMAVPRSGEGIEGRE
jgi:hypothetical protein